MYRPLSPHSLIYKPQSCSVLSVFQRITGGILSSGLSFVLFSLKFVTYHITLYPIHLISCYSNTYLARVIASISAIPPFSLFHHLSNGIRHLIWDKAYYMGKDDMQASAYLLIFFTLSFSVAVLLVSSLQVLPGPAGRGPWVHGYVLGPWGRLSTSFAVPAHATPGSAAVAAPVAAGLLMKCVAEPEPGHRRGVFLAQLVEQ